MSEYLGIWKSEIQDKLVVGKKIARCCNTVQDGLKNLQISYNILNLPQTVTQSGTTKATCGWFADGSGSTIEQNAYYPFGGRHTFGQTYAQTTANRYKFNGKELQTTGNLGLLDYGARMYDTKIGRWLVQDPLAEKYYPFSAYNYCVNNPVNSIDVEGSLVIFINGFFFNPLEAGNSKYWNGFDNAVMNHFNDFNSMYIDGSIGGIYYLLGNSLSIYGNLDYDIYSNLNSYNRYINGYYLGQTNAAKIIAQLHKDSDGVFSESIKIITHSMGSVFSKGYLQAIVDFINANPELCNGLSISEYNFAPFQPQSYSAIQGVDTYQYSHKYDYIAGDKGIKGAKQQPTSNEKEDGHSIEDFLKYISTLPQGVYKFKNGEFIK